VQIIEAMKLVSILICLVFLCVGVSFSQQEPPITKKDVEKLNREHGIIKFLGIRMSKQLIAEIENNKLTGREALLMDTYYNSDGQPELLLYYNGEGEKEKFTKYIYDDNGNKAEEVRFNADSSLINGIIFSYNDDNCLIKRADYDDSGNIVSIHNYNRINDSVIIKKTGLPNGNIIYLQKHLYKPPIDNGIIISSVTYENNGNTIDSVFYTYNRENRVSEKKIFSWLKEEKIEFIEYSYNKDGALNKLYNKNSADANTTEIEYDDFGNIVGIITKDKDDNITKYLIIKHFNLTTKQ
jgi:YD repeat-containing protein